MLAYAWNEASNTEYLAELENGNFQIIYEYCGEPDYYIREQQKADLLPQFQKCLPSCSDLEFTTSDGSNFRLGCCQLQRKQYYPRVFREIERHKCDPDEKPADISALWSALVQLNLGSSDRLQAG